MGGTSQAAAAAVGLCVPTLGMTASARAGHMQETSRWAGSSAGEALCNLMSSSCCTRLLRVHMMRSQGH